MSSDAITKKEKRAIHDTLHCPVCGESVRWFESKEEYHVVLGTHLEEKHPKYRLKVRAGAFIIIAPKPHSKPRIP